MWYIFPQFAGLGHQPDVEDVLAQEPRGGEGVPEPPRSRAAVVGVCRSGPRRGGAVRDRGLRHPDEMKLRSCATLFARVSPGGRRLSGCSRVFPGRRDGRTLQLLGIPPETE